MFSELKKSVNHILNDKLSSPLAGALCFSWFVWNWKIVYLLLFSGKNWSAGRTLRYIQINYMSIEKLYIFPLLSTVFILFVYTRISNFYYGKWMEYKVKQNQIKNKIERNRLLSIEESNEIRFQIQNKEIELGNIIKDKDARILGLVEENKRLSGYLIEQEKKKSEEKELAEKFDLNSKVKTEEEKRKERLAWDTGFELFIKKKGVRENFPIIEKYIFGNTYIESSDVSPGILSYYKKNEIINEYKRGFIRFTEKGKYYQQKIEAL